MPACPRLLQTVCLLAAALLSPASAAPFAVGTGVDSGPGSLRQAILDANASPGRDSIVFSMGRSTLSVAQITVAGALPDITDPVVIQGSYGTWPADVTAVEIISTGLAPGQSLLTITSGGTSLKDLILVSTTAGAVGLTLNGGGGNTLEGIQVGITSAKLVAPSSLHGMVVASDDNIMTGCFVGGASDGDGIRITGSRNLFKLGFVGIRTGRSWSGVRATNKTGVHLLGGSDNVVEGLPSASQGYNIGAYLEAGIHIEGGTGHRIEGNQIYGFVGNPGSAGQAVRIDGGASQIVIGKTGTRDTNGTSIAIMGPASVVRISDVGITASTGHGISVGAGVTDLSVENTVIGFSSGAGIHFDGGSTSAGSALIRHNTIHGNAIGIDVASGMGQVTIGTRRDGSLPFSNKIFANRDGGILVRDPAARVRISENAMQPISGTYLTGYGYAIPINLQPGGEGPGAVTENDALDGDTGPNGLQNKPVITGLEALSGNTIRITGSLSAKPNTTYLIEALQHTAALLSPDRFPDGITAGYLGSHTITTDTSGNAPVSMEVSGFIAGWNTVLTATSPDGETSEYSNAVSTGFPPPRFPLLTDQTSLSLPESGSATGSVFSLVRKVGVTGAFTASLSTIAAYTRELANPAPRPPLQYRFNTIEAWIPLNWDSTLTIPFPETENERVIYLAASDDSSWDPANKPGKLSILTGPGSPVVDLPLQFPDNDPPPVFSLEIVSPVPRPPIPGIPDLLPGFFEGYPSNGTSFRLKADRPVSAPMNYTISVNAPLSTATPNADFRADPGSIQILEAGLIDQFNRAYVIFLTDDQQIEGDETISLNIISTTPGVAFSSSASITIKDNDFYQVSIADASVMEGDTGTKWLAFPVTINPARATDLTLNWVAASGTAVSPSDFTPTSGNLTITAGSTNASIQIGITGETTLETNENFTLTLSNPGALDVRFADASAVGTITNDVFLPFPWLMPRFRRLPETSP